MNRKIYSYLLTSVFLLTIVWSTGCKKDSYYIDGGTITGKYDGSILDYLKSRPDMFDSIVKIIHLAHMDDFFQHDSITFFAPADSSLKLTMNFVNADLYLRGQDSITDLKQIDSSVWRQYLSMYVLSGVHPLSSFSQIDLSSLSAFGGEYYVTYGNKVCNIGVVFSSAGGVQYAGYRYLVYSYIPDISGNQSTWYSVAVATSDMKPRNGIVHVLQYPNVYFGFEPWSFEQLVIAKGIKY